MLPVLRNILPLVAQDSQVREHYAALWKGLHKYVHPSGQLADRKIGPTALHVVDAFDQQWAVDILATARDVFDIILLAVLRTFPKAVDLITQEGLSLDYPLLTGALGVPLRSTSEPGRP